VLAVVARWDGSGNEWLVVIMNIFAFEYAFENLMRITQIGFPASYSVSYCLMIAERGNY
jgi:hypothetical protein